MYQLTITYYEDHIEWIATANGCICKAVTAKDRGLQINSIITEHETGVALMDEHGERVSYSIRRRGM